MYYMTKNRVLQIRLDETMLARLDEQRGPTSRSDWIRNLINANDTRHEPGGDLAVVAERVVSVQDGYVKPVPPTPAVQVVSTDTCAHTWKRNGNIFNVCTLCGESQKR